MTRRERKMSDSIRSFARWGPFVPWSVALMLVGLAWIEARQGVEAAVIISSTLTPVLINIGSGFLIRWLRPLMLANADRWDAIERET